MPVPPVVTIVIVVTVTVVAGLAFKEFVYEPHLAHKLEAWRSDFNMRREQRRRRSLGVPPIAVSVDTNSNDFVAARRSNFELDELTPRAAVSRRNEFNESQAFRNRFGRNTEEPSTGASSALEAPNVSLPHVPLIPTQLSTPSTPTSENAMRRALTPDAAPTPTRYLSHRSSRSTLRSPSPPASYPPAIAQQQTLRSPDVTRDSLSISQTSSFTPSHESDRDSVDFDVLSSSSGPGSPFSDFSFAAMQSPFVPTAEPSARVTSPSADPAREMDFVSVPSPGSASDDSEESGSEEEDSGSDDFAMSSSAQEDDLASSGVFSWASASAHSADEA